MSKPILLCSRFLMPLLYLILLVCPWLRNQHEVKIKTESNTRIYIECIYKAKTISNFHTNVPFQPLCKLHDDSNPSKLHQNNK